MVKIEFWDLFRATVEGRPSQASSQINNGVPGFFPQPIPKNAKPNLVILAKMLRERAAIPQEIRYWLADMMDEEADSEFQFKKLSRRKRGRRRHGPSANMDAAKFIMQLMDKGEPRKKVLWEAEKKFNLKPSELAAAVRYRKEAIEVDRKITEAELASEDSD